MFTYDTTSFKFITFAVLSRLLGQPHFTVGLFIGSASELPDADAAAGEQFDTEELLREQLAGQLANHGVIPHEPADRRPRRDLRLRNVVTPVPEPEPQLRSQEQQHDLRSTPARR